MMNKGLEVIEAHHLFGLDESRIDVVIHPQSVVHSLVEYVDGSVLAQLGSPDMRIPIAHALAWPTRMATSAARLDLASLAQLTFERPDPTRFPALGLARRSLQTGGAAPTILNAANEVAVHAFLAGRLGFLEIVGVVEHVLARMPVAAAQTMEDVLAIDGEARSRAGERIGTQSGALRMTAP
jgi:1-deoxy-D-xylulose-5-phosphate reductoisomerase